MREHLLAYKGTVLHTAKDHSSICMCVHVHACVCVCMCFVRRKENYLANQKLTFSFKTTARNTVGVSHCGSYFFNCINFEALFGVWL